MTVNGMKCFTLFDTGSTTDILSPEFAKIAKTRIFQLSNPVTLQLGTKGSKSKINYGCDAEFSLGNEETTISGKSYFDVANIDRYDLVIGCHFMRKHGIAVDLNTDSIRIKGKRIPTIPVEEEQQELIRRSSKRKAPTEEDIPALKERWLAEYSDIMDGVPEQIPPWRVINHTIPLVDPDKQYNYYLPRCPDSLRGHLKDKIDLYCRAGWWEPTAVAQGIPMLCVPK
ncbi:hypothetical protein K435DRAFT_693361, partial [Dendrothele bispora CBS 962.96]